MNTVEQLLTSTVVATREHPIGALAIMAAGIVLVVLMLGTRRRSS